MGMTDGGTPGPRLGGWTGEMDDKISVIQGGRVVTSLAASFGRIEHNSARAGQASRRCAFHR
jgi:hypothetical protein